MSTFDLLLSAGIIVAAAGLLCRSLKRQWTCTGCAGCSCGHTNSAARKNVAPGHLAGRPPSGEDQMKKGAAQ